MSREGMEEYFNESFTSYELNQINEYAKQEAIEFAKWADNDYWRRGTTNIWTYSIGEEGAKEWTTEQLYDLFKEQNP